jgi:raffinose/stachyose/melibiose transport system permease protein
MKGIVTRLRKSAYLIGWLILLSGSVYAQDRTVELTVYAQAYTPGITTGDNPKPLTEFARLGREFEKLHPGVKVRFIKNPYGDYRTWLITQCKGETAPDIIWAHADWCNQDAKYGWFVNLDPFLAAPNPHAPDQRKWVDWFYADATNTRRAPDAHLYTLPIDQVTTGFYYNKDIFRKAGVEPPQTWAEFMVALQKIKDAGYIPMLMTGLQEMRLSWTKAVLLDQLWSAKLPLMDVRSPKHGGYEGIDAQEFVRAYKKGIFSVRDPRYAEMLRLLKEWSHFFPTGFLGSNDDRLFRLGKAAIWLDGSWYMTRIHRDPLRTFDFGVFHWPKLTKASSPYAPDWEPGQYARGIGGASSLQYAITNTAIKNDKVALCVDFLRFITAPQNLEPLVYEASMFIPNVKGCRPNPLLQPFEIAFKAGYSRFGGEGVLQDAEYNDFYFRTLQGYLGGTVSEEAAAQRLEQALKGAMTRQLRDHAPDWFFDADWNILRRGGIRYAEPLNNPEWVYMMPTALLSGCACVVLLLLVLQPRVVWREAWRKRGLYVFLLPTFALLLVFNYYPILSALYHSLFHWKGGGEATWAGLHNFKEFLRDRTIWDSAANMVKLLLFNVAHTIAIPLFVAELIFHLKSERLRYLYRVMFVVPMVVPGIVVILIWGFIYDYNLGLVNQLLTTLGLSGLKQAWLGDPRIALYALMFMGFPWVGGFALLIYYAGLQNIPVEVFESAHLDGARAWTRFRNVDLPLVFGQMKLLIVLTFIGGVQGFQTSLILTTGGPSYSTMVPGLRLYQNAISFDKMGYACAIGVVLFLVILGLTYVNMTYLKSGTESGTK